MPCQFDPEIFKPDENDTGIGAAGRQIRRIMTRFMEPYVNKLMHVNKSKDEWFGFLRDYVDICTYCFGKDSNIVKTLKAEINNGDFTAGPQIIDFNTIQKHYGFPFRAIATNTSISSVNSVVIIRRIPEEEQNMNTDDLISNVQEAGPTVWPHYEKKHIITSSKELYTRLREITPEAKLKVDLDVVTDAISRGEAVRRLFIDVAQDFKGFNLSTCDVNKFIHNINISNNWIPDVATVSRVNQLFRDFDIPYIAITRHTDGGNKVNIIDFNWADLRESSLASFLWYCCDGQGKEHDIVGNIFSKNLIDIIISLYHVLFRDKIDCEFFLAPDDIHTVPGGLYYDNWDVGAVDTRWVNHVLSSIGLSYSIEMTQYQSSEGSVGDFRYRVLGHAQGH